MTQDSDFVMPTDESASRQLSGIIHPTGADRRGMARIVSIGGRCPHFIGIPSLSGGPPNLSMIVSAMPGL